ncbi:MAG TPA: sensor domain-containing diguanylate cyclase, partial [Paraburkholderia sp.]|nr:sensor domain-containing diguanylate cyclase [Paraburkholderia sp.]
MKRNLLFRLLARLRVGRKLLLIYLLDLTAVVYISSILIHEKYIAIDFSNREIVGNAYVRTVRDALVDVALAGAGRPPSPFSFAHTAGDLADAERQYGANMGSAALNERVRQSLMALAQHAHPDAAEVNDALVACRELVTRVGNQSNLILDPDLDSYYSMSLAILRYPALLDSINRIGRQLHSKPQGAATHDEMRTRYLVLEGQLDAVLQGLRSDFAEASAANHTLESALGPSVGQMRAAVEAYRSAAQKVVDNGGTVDPALLDAVDATQQNLIDRVQQVWSDTG